MDKDKDKDKESFWTKLAWIAGGAVVAVVVGYYVRQMLDRQRAEVAKLDAIDSELKRLNA